MRPGERVPIGDQLERAIEHHVDIEHELEQGEAEQPSGRSLRRTLVWLTITAISLYLVAPSLLDTLSSWRDLDELAPIWLLAMAGLQVAAMTCLWMLQRIALNTRRWHPVVTSQLAGNALAKVAPGGGAMGAALQYRMLVEAGIDRARAVAGLTAANILIFAVVLALPVFAIPTIIRGSVDSSLVEATIIGAVVFVALGIVGTLVLAFDTPLAWLGHRLQRIRNRMRRAAQPMRSLPDRLLHERNRILAAVGPRWKEALAATVGRWAFDYATLLAALAAVGSTPRPAIVLLAFCTAQLLTQIPVTPGGLGFVEAGMTATLTLAGVSPGKAVLATFAYRLFTYWLPIPVGLVAGVLHRRRYVRLNASP